MRAVDTPATPPAPAPRLVSASEMIDTIDRHMLELIPIKRRMLAQLEKLYAMAIEKEQITEATRIAALILRYEAKYPPKHAFISTPDPAPTDPKVQDDDRDDDLEINNNDHNEHADEDDLDTPTPAATVPSVTNPSASTPININPSPLPNTEPDASAAPISAFQFPLSTLPPPVPSSPPPLTVSPSHPITVSSPSAVPSDSPVSTLPPPTTVSSPDPPIISRCSITGRPIYT